MFCDMDPMAQLAALRKSTDDFRDALPVPKDWKDLMRMRYPQIPEDVKLLHLLYWLPRPLPPPKVLCPPARYVKVAWTPSLSEWRLPSPNLFVHPDLIKGTLMPHKMFPMGPKVVDCMGDPPGISRPEGTVQAGDDVLVVHLVDLFNLPDNLDTVLNRLFHYLEITGATFGAVACYSSTWMCMRDGHDAEGNPLLRVSAPDDRPGLALGFLVNEAMKERTAGQYRQTTYRDVCTRVPTSFDMSPVLALLQGMCETLGVEDGAARFSGAFGVEDLQNIRLLPASREKDPKMSMGNVRNVMKAMYNGEAVVVKTRDLASPYCIGFEGSLKRFVREVAAHLTLCKLEDRFVPKLLSWGFLRGGMLAYVMTRDVGNDKLESDAAGESHNPDRRRVLESASAALAEVHKSGILHGDIDVNKVVTKRDEAGRWTAMLVGFAQSHRVEVLSQEWSLGAAKEMAELREFIEFLVDDSAWRGKRHKAEHYPC